MKCGGKQCLGECVAGLRAPSASHLRWPIEQFFRAAKERFGDARGASVLATERFQQ